MKLQHFIIIFLIIILPFSIICRAKMADYTLMLRDQVRLNNVIDSATQDALDMLVELNDEFQMMYFNERFNINQTLAKESMEAFFHTMAVNFNMPYKKEKTQAYFSMYIPAVLIIGYDGFFVYSVDEVRDTEYAYQISPKIPYSYFDKETGTLVNFTLGNYVTILSNSVMYEGELMCDYQEDIDELYTEYYTAFGNDNAVLNNIPDLTNNMSLIVNAIDKANPGTVPSFLLPDSKSAKDAIPLRRDYGSGDELPSDFHAKRREVIISLIKDVLKEEINEHNTYARMYGSVYHFQLPEIANDDWVNSINDISVMSFIQGMPIGTSDYFDNYALSGSRIVQTDYIYGDVERYYHSSSCKLIAGFVKGDPNFESTTEIDNVFVNRIYAAEAGYYPCNHCNP